MAEWVRCENTHEAIVSQTVYDTVQVLLRRDTMRGGEGRESYLYSGMLFCADCGCSMVRRNDSRCKKDRAVYICSSYNLRKSCSRHTVPEEKLNEAVLLFLRDYIEKLCDTRRLAKKLTGIEIGYENAKAYDEEIKGLKEELQKYSVLKSSLYQDLRDGLINESQFQRYRNDYSKLETELENAIREQEKIIEEIYERGLLSDVRLSNLKEKLNISGLDRAILVTFIDKILVLENGKIEIHAKFDDRIDKVEDLLPMEKEAV